LTGKARVDPISSFGSSAATSQWEAQTDYSLAEIDEGAWRAAARAGAEVEMAGGVTGTAGSRGAKGPEGEAVEGIGPEVEMGEVETGGCLDTRTEAEMTDSESVITVMAFRRDSRRREDRGKLLVTGWGSAGRVAWRRKWGTWKRW
jgi:hypothetical protein